MLLLRAERDCDRVGITAIALHNGREFAYKPEEPA